MEHVRDNIFQDTCPHCESVNYFDNGDPNNMSILDVDGLRCWKCKHEWLTEWSSAWTSKAEAYIKDGTENE